MSTEQTHTQRRRSAWSAVALAAVLLLVEAVIVAESWRGLTGFAYLIGITGPAAWGVPVTLDGVSLVAALVALRAELSGEASGLYRAVLFVFTGASAAANYWHGRTTGGEEAALYLGGMSVAVAVVFALALRQIRREDRRRAGTVTGRLPRFSVAHWARFPGLTWRAWSLAVRDGHTSPRVALDAALALRGTYPGRVPEPHPETAPEPYPEYTPAAALDGVPVPALDGVPVPAPETAPGRVPGPAPRRRTRARTPGRTRPRTRRPVTESAAEVHFTAELAAGEVPSVRRIRSELRVGQDRAQALQAHLQQLTSTST